MRNERKRLSGLLIQPLGVVDRTEQWPLLGRLREQTERRKPHQKAIRSCARSQPECDAHRVLLWARNAFEPIEHRRTQLLEGGERELHLRLDARGPLNVKARSRADCVVQQGRLAHARLAEENEGAALTPADRAE